MRLVPASPEMHDSFGLDQMAAPEDVRVWFEALFPRIPLTPEAVGYVRSLRLEMGTTRESSGGGYWFGDRGLVLLRGAQDEAAVHELAHAWWERERPSRRDRLMDTLRALGERPPDGFPVIAELAHAYCRGIPSQPDPTSPTGAWRGMLAEDNDHETFAGFCSGVRADARALPPSLRPFYRGFLAGA